MTRAYGSGHGSGSGSPYKGGNHGTIPGPAMVLEPIGTIQNHRTIETLHRLDAHGAHPSWTGSGLASGLRCDTSAHRGGSPSPSSCWPSPGAYGGFERVAQRFAEVGSYDPANSGVSREMSHRSVARYLVNIGEMCVHASL